MLPVFTFEELSEIDRVLARNTTPLACYLFSNDAKFLIISPKINFGGGAINDTIAHLGNPHLAFGGVGSSGIGSYHGRHSFETFSHIKV